MAFLDLNNLRKLYGQAVGVEHFQMAIERGEFVSFLGPSGCGKTTTLRMVAGFEQPSSGTIILDGKDITRLAPNQRNVGMVFQSYALFPNMTVAQNIAFGLKLRKQAGTTIDRRVQELLTMVHLAEYDQRYPYQLSGGQQQRIALARALAIEPQVLLLDEPLSALDAKIRVALRNEIRAIQRQLGITTIYVTHDQEEALALSDRIVVMSAGRIEQIGTPFEIYNAPQTSFVATFVGALNTLSATVSDPRAGHVLIDQQKIQLGRVLDGCNIGDKINVALRPEALTMVEANHFPNRLPALVDDVAFLGSVLRVKAKVGVENIQFDLLNSPGLVPPRPNQAINLGFAPEAALIVQNVPPQTVNADVV
jgi:putative spermidine/putrescine transport system ATP-binding protein